MKSEEKFNTFLPILFVALFIITAIVMIFNAQICTGRFEGDPKATCERIVK